MGSGSGQLLALHSGDHSLNSTKLYNFFGEKLFEKDEKTKSGLSWPIG